MEFQLTDPVKTELFASVFQYTKNVCDQINLDVNADRIFIQTMDSSKVSILEITFPATWFHSYTCTVPVTLGISATLLYKILNSREKAQPVRVKHGGAGDDTLYCSMEGETKTHFHRHFEIPLIELEVEVMNIPAISYEAEFTMPSTSFSTLITQLKAFGETLDIQCNEDRIALVSKSSDQGKMSVDIGIDDLTEFTIDEECQLNLSFAIQYLSLISAFGKVAKDVSVRLHHEYPIRIDYEQDEMTIKYYLAPKISEE